MPNHRRRLAAILVGDLVGYTASMAMDEERALQAILHMRRTVKPIVEEHEGTWIKEVGDGFLVRFDSAVGAVACGIAIQRAMARVPDAELRLGIHLGDVVIGEEDVYGDGVNVAARLELLAVPGGICVSDQVYELVRNQKGIRSVPLGRTDLPQRVFAWAVAGEGMPLPDAQDTRENRADEAHGKIDLLDPEDEHSGRPRLRQMVLVLLVAAGCTLAGWHAARWTARDFGRDASAVDRDVRVVVTDVGHEVGAPGGDASNSRLFNEMLERAIQGMDSVALLPPDEREMDLQLLRSDPEQPVTPALARQIALRHLDVRAAVIADVRRVGSRYSLDIGVVDPEHGTPTRTFEADAVDRDGLLPAMRQVIDRTIRGLPDALAAIPASRLPEIAPEADRVTTDDARALEDYVLARAAADAGEWRSALDSAQRAIDRDSAFAMAHILVAAANRALGRTAANIDPISRAHVMAGGIDHEAEQDLVLGAVHRARGRCAAALGALDAARSADGAFYAAHAWWDLTSQPGALACLGRFGEAAAALGEAPEEPTGSSIARLGALTDLHLRFTGDLDGAREAVRRYVELDAQRAGGVPLSIAMQPILTRWTSGDLTGAAGALDLLARQRAGAPDLALVHLHRAASSAYGGDLDGARLRTREAAEAASAVGASRWEAQALWQLAWLRDRRGDAAAWRASLTDLAATYPDPIASGARAWLAVERAADGDGSAVMDFEERIASRLSDEREVRAFRALIAAGLARAAGESGSALAHLEDAVAVAPGPSLDTVVTAWQPTIARAELARAHEEAGNVDRAIEVWRGLQDQHVQAIYQPSLPAALLWVEAHGHLGRLLSIDGDERGAAAADGVLLRTWSDAAPEEGLTGLEEARSRAAERSGGG